MAYSVLLVGSGGVGVIAAYALELKSNVQITTVVRSDYSHVKQSGYRIESVDYGIIEKFMPSKIVPSIEDAAAAGPYDYVVISTKNTPDIFRMEETIDSVITAGHTAIVLIQNGIDIEKAFFERFPQNVVLSGVSMISSTNFNGTIKHVGTDSLRIGAFHNPNLPHEVQQAAARTFVKLYQSDKNECLFDENVRYSRWRKLIYNATLNSICALTNVDTGRLEIFGGTDSMVRGAMAEVLAIARSDGVELPGEVVDAMIRSDDGEYYAPSMLADVRKGNYIESEVICGNPVRIAQRNGVSAPILSLVYAMLCVVQKRIAEERGRITLPGKRPEAPYRA